MHINIEIKDDIAIKAGGLAVFPVTVVSSEDVEIFVDFEGVNASCINCRGVDYLGKTFKEYVQIKKNVSRRLWCLANGIGKGALKVFDRDGKLLSEKEIIINQTAQNGDEQIGKFDKIAWLNSTTGIDDNVTKQYEKVKRSGSTVEILGRKFTLGEIGFPQTISSFFGKNLKIGDNETQILSEPTTFTVSGENFINRSVSSNDYDDKAVYKYENESENFKMRVDVRAEFDGFIDYGVTLIAKNDVNVKDIFLDIPVSRECLKYFIGLGKKGGLFDKNLDWKWNEENQQDCFWTGDVNAGVKFKFKGENYVKPFVNIYYNHRKLNIPESWGNGGKGGIKFINDVFKVYSGDRTIKQGESLFFGFEIIVTPLKEIDLKKQFGMRFFHAMYNSDTWLERAKNGGANIINVHHGNDLNPFINYPFVENESLKQFVSEAHENNIAVKLYYTIRELTVNMPEFEVFRDLGYEIIAKRNESEESFLWQGEAKDWIIKNIGDDVIPAWRQPLKGKKYKDFFDSAVITDGQSRLCNFYVEGLKYLVDKIDIDGIYIDDVAYDRNTAKRVRKVLDKKKTAYIDFHHWNHHVPLAGNGNCATMYAELYPYIDKLWVGEGFDYDESPEYWLTEISGLPFGLMSEMMDAGNQYRGLVFGMTNRLGWETNKSTPKQVWNIIDKYNLASAELFGWWDDNNRVIISDANVRATEYRVGGKTYIAVANFSDKQSACEISLKDNPDARFYAPELKDFQSEREITDGKLIIDGAKGLFLTVK